jgi:branched-chain amino acid transport system ATP-binding protein
MTVPPPQAKDGMSLLRTEGLVKSFGGVTAVDRLDIEVAAGELRCIIGPNGAGKSTLFGLLSGIHLPDLGIILFKGAEISNLPRYRRVRMGLCQKFQTTRIYRNLTVAQNLLIARRAQPESRQNGRLEWALRTLGLTSASEMPAGHCRTAVSSGLKSALRLLLTQISCCSTNPRQG